MNPDSSLKSKCRENENKHEVGRFGAEISESAVSRHHLCYDISLEVKGSSHKHILSASHPVQSFGQNTEDLESRQGAKAAG